MSESECMETRTDTGSQKENKEDGGISTKQKLSIQQILEGMTNEFNKTGTKPAKKLIRLETPAPYQEKVHAKVAEDNAKPAKAHKCMSQIVEEINIIKENVPEKKSEKIVNKDETGAKSEIVSIKKDGSIPPRIILTFRTIDENTDNGKKTKISSCTSNLSLVPDELAYCDRISGVSVKIENFDEICDDTDKSDTEDSQRQNTTKTNELNPEEKKEQNTPAVKSDLKNDALPLESAKSNLASNSENQKSAGIPVADESLEKLELTPPNSKKNRRKRLQESSEETGLKRSARRLSKESVRSTVLENAMARKEKSNYTQESIKRKYTKPGRPKKLTPDKKDNILKKDNLKKLCPSNIPKLNPLESPKLVPNKKDALPKLNPLDSSKSVPEKKELPKLSPLTIRNVTKLDSVVNNTTSSVNSPQKLNKYAGMPKLTPIVKNCETLQPKIISDPISSDNKFVKNEPHSKNIVEPFLKPNLMKPKRDRVRPRVPTGNARKIKETSLFEDNLPNTTESISSVGDLTVEDGPTPAKKARRSMAPSPNTAEGQASKPESTAILSKMPNEKRTRTKLESMQCLCEVRSQLYVTITSGETPLYCTALDSIDNRIVGCCNEVDHDDVAMRRPSSRIPFIILCRMHKDRLIRHNCCPTCGLFCSQGKFVHCSNGHQYHRDCEMVSTTPDKKSLCPHCASHGLSFDVIITMTGKRKPIHIPSLKRFTKGPTAKITLPGAGDNTKLAEQQPAVRKTNEPLISSDIINIPEPTINEEVDCYTNMSLYNAAVKGDLQKLINVLASGINANHVFREQGHRTGLHAAADGGFLACVHVLVQAGTQLDVLDRNQLSPLMLAATNGKADIVRYLMRIGADVTLKGEDGMTALHMAAKSGHLDVCKIILSECKVPRTLVDSVDDGGWTSLIWACEFRHADVARFLIDNKCDPLIRDAEQNIALHWSAYSGSSEITELLLNLGCDANSVNVHGDTPLHIASRQDQYAVCVLLLSRGAKVEEANAIGETAIDCCSAEGDTLNALKLNFTVNQNSQNTLERTVKILTNDITRGKETNPVQCVNGFDFEDKPTDFVYITENCFTSNISVDRTITSLQSCRCEDNCSSDKCFCGNISLRCWYDDEGKLVPEFNYADPPMLFECNPACDCNKITCNNRVVQHGLTQRFQLFRTNGKGWGVRSLRHISKGSYVCEYVGEIISDSEADHREDDSYLFDLDNREGETYCIDARRYGNLARFINHSCSPNLLPVRVFIEHQDLHFPRIAFFAKKDIDADEELGFDYGEKFWIVKCKSFTCTCGAENCRYSDKTIQITLDNYRKKIQQEEILAVQTPVT